MPLAVDTNVLLRALVDDGTDQTHQAVKRFFSTSIFVPSSVMLETEWVLRSRVKLDRPVVNDLLSSLLAYHHVEMENRPLMLRAVTAHRQGLDFADAVHLFAASKTDGLCTFDDEFQRRAKRIKDAVPVISP